MDLQTRMQHWASLIELVPATVGAEINYKFWRSKKRLARNITKGQIGCYESHVRVWQMIVDRNLPSALILEDDANIEYTQTTVDRLREVLHELNTLVDWDVFYVGNIGLHPIREKITQHINRPSGWEGLYTYLITQRGARRLLQAAFPISMAVDIFVGDQAAKGNIQILSMNPPLNFVVPVQSDTDVRI
jgi:glycosyl transferase family 25